MIAAGVAAGTTAAATTAWGVATIASFLTSGVDTAGSGAAEAGLSTSPVASTDGGFDPVTAGWGEVSTRAADFATTGGVEVSAFGVGAAVCVGAGLTEDGATEDEAAEDVGGADEASVAGAGALLDGVDDEVADVEPVEVSWLSLVAGLVTVVVEPPDVELVGELVVEPPAVEPPVVGCSVEVDEVPVVPVPAESPPSAAVALAPESAEVPSVWLAAEDDPSEPAPVSAAATPCPVATAAPSAATTEPVRSHTSTRWVWARRRCRPRPLRDALWDEVAAMGAPSV